MNRHDRRKRDAQEGAQSRRAQAIARRKKLDATPFPPARADGRPLYFDIGGLDKVECYECDKAGVVGILHARREAVMNDPANPHGEFKSVHTICIHHLPDDAVIYDPGTNLCRDKRSENEWMEDTPLESISDAFTA
jgi:hypothetical protein